MAKSAGVQPDAAGTHSGDDRSVLEAVCKALGSLRNIFRSADKVNGEGWCEGGGGTGGGGGGVKGQWDFHSWARWLRLFFVFCFFKRERERERERGYLNLGSIKTYQLVFAKIYS